VFTAQLTPHQVHRIGVGFTNGATTGAATTELHNLALFVNNTPVNLVDPEASGNYGAYGLIAGNDRMRVSNFTSTHNIVYRNGGAAYDLLDWTDGSEPDYVDPNPGAIDYNVLYQNVAKSADTVFGNLPVDADTVIANPQFMNEQAGDYTLQPDSPAMATGFVASGVPLAP
jgi:hypothetical protein